MSKRKAVIKTQKRRPYEPPAVKQLDAQSAKAMLEAKAIQGDKEAEKLLEEIRRKLESQ